MSADYDITQDGDRATVLLPGTRQVVGRLRRIGDAGWTASSPVTSMTGVFPTRQEAAANVRAWWDTYHAPPEHSPTSEMALALELHERRGHTAAPRRIRNWLCSCAADALEFHGTDWVRRVRGSERG